MADHLNPPGIGDQNDQERKITAEEVKTPDDAALLGKQLASQFDHELSDDEKDAITQRVSVIHDPSLEQIVARHLEQTLTEKLTGQSTSGAPQFGEPPFAGDLTTKIVHTEKKRASA